MSETTQKFISNHKIQNWQPIFHLLFLITITLIVYWNVTKNGFTDWDDDIYVINSEIIKSLSFSSILQYFKTITANLYTPLTTLSYAIDYKLYGLQAEGYHITSLVLHIINIVLVYIFINKLIGIRLTAFIVSILFAVHPLNVEAVAWISARKDLLFSLFYLLGLITYLRYLEKKSVSLYFAVFIFFLFSCFSKPVAITFPAVLLLIDFYFNRQLTIKDILSKVPLLLVSAAFLVLGFYLASQAKAFDYFIEGYTLFDKICLAAYSYTYYLYNTIIPVNLTNFHSFPHKAGMLLEVEYLAAPVVIIALMIAGYKLRKRLTVLVGLVFFTIMIGPTLRLIPAGYPIAAERYYYLASIGLFLTIAIVLNKLLKRDEPIIKYVAITILVVFTLALLRVSSNRVSDWENSFSLWQSALKNDPTLYLGHTHLGKILDDNGSDEAALVHYERALNIYSENPDILNSASVILIDNGNTKKAKIYLDKAIDLDPESELPYYNRGNIFKLNKAFVQAIKDYNVAIKIKNDFAEAYNNRGASKIMIGDTLGAYEDFKNAAQLQPDNKMMTDNWKRAEKLVQIE